MLVVNWKGKIGYGDIVSPICYAHNMSYKLDTKVKLVFHWKWDQDYKLYPDDPETLMERASFIFDRCIKANVILEHRYNSELPFSFNHDNYEWGDDLHNYWHSAIRNTSWSDDIIVNGTNTNKQSMSDYGKKWKDPIGEEQWVKFIEKLKQRYNVVEVGYRTPVAKLFKAMTRAKLFIGYHGNTAAVAKFVQIPMIVFSSKQNLTSTTFSHACVKSTIEENFLDKVDTYIQHSRMKLDQTLKRYYNYHISEELVRSLKWS